MIKCIVVVPAIAQEASGPSYSVPRLCQGLVDQGVSVELFTNDLALTKTYPFPVNCFSTAGPFANRLGRSPAMFAGLKKRINEVDIVHNNSLWMMANVYPGLVVRGSTCSLVTSPRGTLSSWALKRARLRKRLMWLLGQRMSLQRAKCIHATSEAEYADVRRLGLRQPVAIIPNGIDLPVISNAPMRPAHTNCTKTKKRLLYLGRVHPVKALDQLVRAWELLGDSTCEWELRIVGPGEAVHVEALRTQVENSGTSNIFLGNALFGDEKSREYLKASAYVLPSHSENFAMTVAEALAHGLPCVVSKGAPWSGLANHQCGWWVDNDTDSLARSLMQLIKTPPEELSRMGLRGRSWIERDFGWDAIVTQMKQVYTWIRYSTARPDCIRID